MSASGFNPASSGQSGQNSSQGLWQLIGQFLGHHDDPYKDANEAASPFYDKAQANQNPFIQRGNTAGNSYADWTNSQKDPSSFINNLMGKYQESPWAHNLQQQNIRAGTAAASADGTIGSTPFAQQLQQNSNNISSQDQNQWLGNVLGINTNYGNGLNNQVNQGQNAANTSSQLFQTQGNNAGSAAYGSTAGKNQQNDDMWASLAKFMSGT